MKVASLVFYLPIVSSFACYHTLCTSAQRLSTAQSPANWKFSTGSNRQLLQLTLCMLALFGCPASVMAEHAKTDVITLYNGDRVTCEIKALLSGLLECKTDNMGTVNIEWPEIAQVESEYRYEVRLSDAKRFFGRVKPSSVAGEFVLQGEDGRHVFSWLEVVELRPVEKSFRDRIDVYLALGASYTKASSVGSAAFNTEIVYETEDYRNSLTARIGMDRTEEEVTRSSKVDLTRRSWTDRARVFRIVLGNYEQNDALALDHRYVVGGGLGRYFIDTNRMRLSSAIGLQATSEEQQDEDIGESLEAFVNLDFATWRFKTPELQVSVGGNLFPSLTESGRLRGDADIRFSWELVKDLFWDVTAYGTYDNESDSGEDFDYGITTGVGWTY
jgi:Protein of unknown function, DUF481